MYEILHTLLDKLELEENKLLGALHSSVKISADFRVD